MNVDPDEVVVSVARIVDEEDDEAIEEGMEAESIDSEREEDVGASDTSEDAVDEAEELSEDSSE